MGDTSLVFNLVGKDKVTPTLAKVAGAARASSLASTAGTVAMGAAIASAAAWAVSLGSAVYGSIGIIPGLAGAATASLIGMKVASFGLGAAWKATGAAMEAGAGGGGGAAKQLAAAQREVTTAQEALTRSQIEAQAATLAVTAAREQEIRRLRDLSLSLTGARINEKQAVQGVRDAMLALRAARRTGTADDIRRATYALEEAQLAVEETKNRTIDLQAEQDKAAKVGVEGSDAVTQAQQHQVDATKAVADATQRLADAQQNLKDASSGAGGGVDAAAQAMAQLAPSARALITTLHQIGPAWTAVRKAMQESTFAGVAGDVKRLSDAYLPTMTSRLTQMGAAFNNAIRQSLGLASSKKFVADVDTSLSNTNKALGILGASFAPLLSALNQMGAVGSQFLPQIAGWVQSIAERFERWVIAARASGQLQQWLSSGVAALEHLGTLTRNVLGIVGALLRGGGTDAGNGLLTTLANATGRMKDFLNSTQGQAEISRVMGDLRNLLAGVADVLPAVVSHAHEFSDELTVAGTVAHFLADHAGTVAKLLPLLAAGFLLSRTAETGANIASVVRIPLMIAQIAANWGLRSSLKAATAALVENTVATTGTDVVQKRSLISMIAMRAGMIAGSVAAGIATAAQWLWNAAMYASPVGLIILAIILLVAAFVYLWTHSAAFREFWIGLWNDIWGFLKAVGSWFAGPFANFFVGAYHWVMNTAREFHDFVIGKWNALIGFVTSIPARMRNAASGMWDGIKDAFRGALNWLISKWNSFHLTIPGIDFLGIHIPSVTVHTAQLPMLGSGGHIAGGGLAVVGDRGAEVVDLPTGSTVYPHGTGPGGGRFELYATTSGDRLVDEVVKALRLRIRSEGGDVQAVLGASA